MWDPRKDAYGTLSTDTELEAYARAGAAALNWGDDADSGYFSVKTL
jgi:hypothetical protein